MYPKVLLISAFVLSFTLSYSQSKNKAYNDYIQKYHSVAQRQQSEYGIPSSIILAQGLLESNAGASYLAVNANNHFGIKCHNWTGATEYRDDDAKNECFRKYKHALDSYEDHSQFLIARPRYAALFKLKPSDYEGWAHGLKKAGYATDPAYAFKLISIIDTYDLHQYDLKKTDRKKETDQKRQKEQKQQRQQKEPSYEKFVMGYVDAEAKHNVYYNNNIRCVLAVAGDTYGSIADEFKLSEKRIRSYNDVNTSAQLKAGDWVYVRPKKKKAAKKHHTHTVQTGESMYSIAQYYGVRLESLYKLNEMPYSAGAQAGQELKLR
ncbi:MAG: glucosaminidase domain-containing protein [Prevotellaceae bacterium]|jgi:LysM repeat protein|nr:glucosaminidase domain-containing protein [Prevotellaceae bacterium]